MKWMNLRLWLNTSQRRALEMMCLLVLLCAGCITGTVFILNGSDNVICRFCLAYGLPEISTGILLSSLRWCGGILIMGFFLGFCGIGQPLLIMLLYLHGFSAGCCLTELSLDIAAEKPFMYTAAAVYTITASFTLLLGMRESARLSCTSMKACLSESDSSDMRRRFRLYCIRYAVLIILIIAESAGFTAICKIL